jgi:hypothetical protein
MYRTRRLRVSVLPLPLPLIFILSAIGRTRRGELLILVELEFRFYCEGKKQTPNPPTPKASAWQALTCLAVAKAKEERSTSNAQVRNLGARPSRVLVLAPSPKRTFQFLLRHQSYSNEPSPASRSQKTPGETGVEGALAFNTLNTICSSRNYSDTHLP